MIVFFSLFLPPLENVAIWATILVEKYLNLLKSRSSEETNGIQCSSFNVRLNCVANFWELLVLPVILWILKLTLESLFRKFSMEENCIMVRYSSYKAAIVGDLSSVRL